MKRIELGLRMVALAIVLMHVMLITAKADGLTDAINVERARCGLHALSHEPSLDYWAVQNNGQQRTRGLGHYIFGGLPIVRQNAAWGQPDIPSVIVAWMCSPGHRASILSPDVTHCGGSFDGAYWTCNFSLSLKPKEAKPAVPADKPGSAHGVGTTGSSAAACPTAPPCIFTERVPIRRVGRAFSFRRWLIGGCK